MRSVLKIGIVIDDSLDRIENGVQQYVLTLGDWLIKQGHQVHYLAGETKETPHAVHSLSRNVGVRFNKNRLTMPLPANKQAIKALLAKEAYDVLHVQMPYSPFMAGRVIALAPRDTAIVGTFHILPFGYIQRFGSKALSVVQHATLRRFDAICSVSRPAAEFAKRYFGINSMVIPNTVPLASWKTNQKKISGRVVFLGRLVPRKGCLEFLVAMNKIPAANYKEIIIASDGPQRTMLEKYVSVSNLKNVTFRGFIPEKEKPSLLASADIAVFPSLGGESFGIVLLEAMAAGSGIVLGGDNPGYSAVLAGMDEVLVDPRNTDEFAKTLNTFLTDQTYYDEVSRKQRKLVGQYDTSIVGPKVIEMYKTAIAKTT